MNKENAKNILETYEKIKETISLIQKTTAQALETQRNEYCETLDNRLEELKRQIKDLKAKKGEEYFNFVHFLQFR